VKTQDWKWLTTHREGQFFERKSCYDRSGKRPKRRDARSVARDVSETLAATANADGGTLALGIENDGTPSGVDYPQDRL
jgi:predicted HTH transcriptional regulator